MESFRLDEYKAFDDGGKGMERLLHYVREGVNQAGGVFLPKGPELFEITVAGNQNRITTSREFAKENEDIMLLGLEHPLVRYLMATHRSLGAFGRALAGRMAGQSPSPGVLTYWLVKVYGGRGQFHQRVLMIGLNAAGERSSQIERLGGDLKSVEPVRHTSLDPERRLQLVRSALPEMIRRELSLVGALAESSSCSSRLLGWIELV